jgi:hypothetical protein
VVFTLCVFICDRFATTFDEYVPLEGIFAREALVAVVARKGLDCKMNSLVSLQIMVPVETLWALVALKRSVVRGWLLMLGVTHEVWHRSSVPAVEA